MADKPRTGIEWKLSAQSGNLHLTRNVGGIFKLHNNGKGTIRLVKDDDPNVDNPANHIQPGRTLLVKIAPEHDLVISLVPPAQEANGMFELVTHLTN
jgi:hypothetical protein